jgi:G3E family GTPase
VVDAVNFEQSFDENEEAREQIGFADIVLVNKTDLCAESDLRHLEQRIARLNPMAKVYRTTHSEIDLSLILGTGAFQLDAKLQVDPQFLDDHEHEHDASIGSVVLRADQPVDMNRFVSWINTLVQQQAGGILRTKGVFNARGFNEKILFQSVRMLTSTSRLAAWEDVGSRRTEYVVIGHDLDRTALEEGFAECLVR